MPKTETCPYPPNSVAARYWRQGNLRWAVVVDERERVERAVAMDVQRAASDPARIAEMQRRRARAAADLDAHDNPARDVDAVDSVSNIDAKLAHPVGMSAADLEGASNV